MLDTATQQHNEVIKIMKVITKEIEKKLRANAKKEGVDYADLEPVVKLFQPDGAATMLLSTLDDDGVVQGVFDLGLGYVEMGPAYLPEILAVKGGLGLSIERDTSFKAEKTISQYWSDSQATQRLEAY